MAAALAGVIAAASLTPDDAGPVGGSARRALEVVHLLLEIIAVDHPDHGLTIVPPR